jgi:hypothetical protein
MTLIEVFARVNAPCRGPARWRDLHEMILIALCAVAYGANSWVDVAEWGENNEAWLKGY